VTAQATYDPERRIESARLYGNMNKYAYYFADLLIGSPEPQRTSVIVDTGSRLVGFPCRGCTHCGDHLDPGYDVSQSSSARWLDCRHGCVVTCFKDHCPYTETYSEGSTISGFWFDDLVEIGDSFQKNPPVRARLGCHTNENKLFYTQRANGIMGLAPSEIGSSSDRPTILQELFRDKKHVDTNIFSICLATWGGRLTIGGYNNTYHADLSDKGITWLSMRASHYYFVFPEGLILKGVGSNKRKQERITVATGQHAFGVSIIDSGTTYTYFPGPIFHALVDNLNVYCREHANCGASREGSECFRLLDPLAGPAHFPTLQLQFGNGLEVSWPADGYLHQRGDFGVWCHTFMENNIFQTVFGISFMIHKDMIFDLARGRLGVAEAKCPEHRRQTEILNEAAVEAPRSTMTGSLAAIDKRDRQHSIEVLIVSALMVGLGATMAYLALRSVACKASSYDTMPQTPLAPAGESPQCDVAAAAVPPRERGEAAAAPDGVGDDSRELQMAERRG
jgi:hypothetical protein